MPIRKRLSDPYGDSVKKFNKRLREGPPPPTPKKPSAEIREPFVRALKAVPVNLRFIKGAFFRTIADKYMTEKFEIWGQTLYILPAYMYLDEVFLRCTGASVGRHNANKRGIKPMLRLRGEQKTWYSQVLHWIEDTEYE